MARSRGISPAARARRSLLVDVLVALVLAAIVLNVAAGLGVVAFVGLPLLAVGLLWVGGERLLQHRRRRARTGRPRRA